MTDFDREGKRWCKAEDKAFWMIKAALSPVGSWREARVQSNFWLHSVSGLQYWQDAFQSLNSTQAGLMLTWDCTVRKQTPCRQVTSWIWKRDQNEELQYQEQDFDSAGSWLR